MWLVITIIVVLLAVALIIILSSGKQVLNWNLTQVSETTIETTVMATGYIQPVEEVEVGTQVSGVIEKIYVDYNSVVKKGDLMAVLDTVTLQEKVTQANAALTSANSDLEYAQRSYDRTKELYGLNAATRVALEEVENRLTQAETTVANAKASLGQAEINLGYAFIYSPINGVVLDRSVNTGQTVAASFNTPTLFTIAEDLTKMQVEADVDEADIGQVKVGQKVTFTVDAFPDYVFEGSVSQIRLQALVTNNVVTYTVIVEAPNPEEKLFPGMTASITIVTRSESGMSVPLEATQFNMKPEYAKELGVHSLPAEPETTGNNQYVVWVWNQGRPEPRLIEGGISDGVNLIVESGLRQGEDIVLSAAYEKKKSNGNAVSNPLMPQPPRGGNRGGGGPPR